MADSLERFQDLLTELFQFETADLDFGMYRLLNLKRDEVESFLTEQLPQQVEDAFAEINDDERDELQKQMENARRNLGDDAFNGEERIKQTVLEDDRPIIQEEAEKYEAARKRLEGAEASEARKEEVFNHLYAFFSRYYEDGDFIPRRRYGAHENYAVPYNGEEVFFHWANKDQHYVKTTESFKDYAFTVPSVVGDYRVRFTLTEATVPKDNTKGEARYFFPRPDIAEFHPDRKEFVLPFEYRLSTPEEQEHYTNLKPKTRKQAGQDNVLLEALHDILDAVPDDTLGTKLSEDQRTEKQKENNDDEISLLLKRLKHFTRQQTSDYFIHKDLGGFLERELEFYIKDQVLHLEDIRGDVESKRRLIRIIRRLAEQIIEFLAQIEDAQKRLWEKKKFVLRTDYLITMQHVPEEFWPDILSNEAQLAQWREWFALEPEKDLFNSGGEINAEFLRSRPTLVVDTQHFERGWVRRLLERLPFDDLDGVTDGICIHSENYQALDLLQERYLNEIAAIYIDPPYNTGKDDFIYKDTYQHSSWAAMISGRIRCGWSLLNSQGVLWISLDDNEMAHFRVLCEADTLSAEGFLGEIVWKTGTDNNPSQIAIEHEYVLGYAKDRALQKHWSVPSEKAERVMAEYHSLREKYGNNTERIQAALRKWMKKNRDSLDGVMHFNRVDDQGVYSAQNPANPHPDGYEYEVLHPETKRPCAIPTNGFRFPESTFRKMRANGDIEFGPDETTIPKPKKRIDVAREFLRSVYYEDNRVSTNELDAMFGERVFENPKSPRLLGKLFRFTSTEQDTVVDYFAGSGTTAETVIRLNRSTGLRRSFVVVEMSDLFDDVLLPRIGKAIYTPEWTSGRPDRPAKDSETECQPRVVKTLRLESYDDTLQNVVAEGTQEAAQAREEAHKEAIGEKQYRLRYLVKLPLDASDTMLNLSKLEHPFDYTLEVLTEEGTRHEPVDLAQTFNYLYGLRPRQLDTWVNGSDPTEKEPEGRTYRITRATNREQDKHLMVIWRDMTDFDPEVERRFLETKLEAEERSWDEVLINGDTATPGVESLDPLFKRLMETKEGR